MAGRPTKLTPQVQARIVQAIVGGNDITVAAAYAGIGKATFYLWLERGRKEMTRLEASPFARPRASETPFVDFIDAIEKAQADAETRNVALIAKAAQEGTWTAAAWWLERKYPERWGRKDRHEVTGKDGEPFSITVRRVNSAKSDI
jgi:transposase